MQDIHSTLANDAFICSEKGPAKLVGRGNCSSSLYESQIESYEHQDNSYVHDQPFPKLTLEEEEIYADDDGYQQEYVKEDNYLSFHVKRLGLLNLNISIEFTYATFKLRACASLSLRSPTIYA